MDLLFSQFMLLCVSLSLVSADSPRSSHLHHTPLSNSTEQVTVSSSTQATSTSPSTSPSASNMTKNNTAELTAIITSTTVPIKTGNNPGLLGTSSTTIPNMGPTANLTSVTHTNWSGNGLTMVAFGVMSFILILIVVMVILVMAVSLRGRCRNTKEEGVKGYESVISESNLVGTGEKESITLVSVRVLNTETDTDSPQISSVHSTIVDSEEQELNRDLLSIRAEQKTQGLLKETQEIFGNSKSQAMLSYEETDP